MERMFNSTRCERCPDEATDKCDTCNPNKQPEPVKITIEDAIEYFTEENKNYESILGDRVNLAMEYRINQLAIEALKSKL